MYIFLFKLIPISYCTDPINLRNNVGVLAGMN